ncbi:hypothetical protein JIG36_45495 [Actinoplanes sp. LDG1-06]|uniref:Uncharacterized protein n=1 Tax=Paractinoplanes ovalisporus TaxID=2810368 RepID=A0ABS2ASH4_9ACTN|nr:hypothetical protein [Actinoplanes ovalisporus]MBM2622779.1 hypothetical protein [Actinoplanes ovalisporus]
MTDMFDDCGADDDSVDPFDDLMNGDGQGDSELFHATFDNPDSFDDVVPAVEPLEAAPIVSLANGIDYPAGGYAALPVSGDTAALMQQIDSQLATVRELADVSTLGDGGIDVTPGVSGAVQNTLDLLHNTYSASPATLNWLNGMNNAQSSYAEVSNEVYKHEQTH